MKNHEAKCFSGVNWWNIEYQPKYFDQSYLIIKTRLKYSRDNSMGGGTDFLNLKLIIYKDRNIHRENTNIQNNEITGLHTQKAYTH